MDKYENNAVNFFIYTVVLIDCCLLLFSIVYTLNSKLMDLVIYFDLFTCLVLLIEFIYRYSKAENKKKFLKENCLDLIAIIPIDFFVLRIFRFVKLVKILKLVRFIRISLLTRNDLKEFIKFTTEAHLNKLIVFVIVTIAGSSLLMYIFDPMKLTLSECTWFVITSITTVGYGDIVPQSAGSRFLALILIVVGCLSFSILSGSIAATYSNNVIINDQNKELKKEINNLNKKIDNLTKLVEELEEDKSNFNNDSTKAKNQNTISRLFRNM